VKVGDVMPPALIVVLAAVLTLLTSC